MGINRAFRTAVLLCTAATAGCDNPPTSPTPTPGPIPTITLSTIAVVPSTLEAGQSAQGTATLSGAAPAGGFVVTLTLVGAQAAVLTIPASVTVAAGATSGTFTVTAGSVEAGTQVTVSATGGGQTRTAVVQIAQGTALDTLVVARELVRGEPAEGRVTLSRAAPAAGTTVTLASNHSEVRVPAAIVIQSGQTSGTFAVETVAGGASIDVVLSATAGGVTRTAPVHVSPPAPPPGPRVATFEFTGVAEEFMVPDGVTEITVDAFGGAGGHGGASSFSPGSAGGQGGRVTATLAVQPGERIIIVVGGAGEGGANGTRSAGGFNGGAAGGLGSVAPGAMFVSPGGGGGGGASDIRRGGGGISDRVIVAGGGGGSTRIMGGAGGGLVGGNGVDGVLGGRGGTQTAGGAFGVGAEVGTEGRAGTLAQGGAGGDVFPVYTVRGGAGGGGGYFGGGGGAPAREEASGSGGGGSSYVVPSATNVTHQQGVHSGNGRVIITW